MLTEQERYIAVQSWEAGFAYARDLIADVLDDVRYAIAPPPRLDHEQRVQQRLALFAQCAAELAAELARGRS